MRGETSRRRLASHSGPPIWRGMATRDLESNLSTQIDELAALVAAAETVAGFTGRGISTESGVPDFRSPGQPVDAQQADPVRGLPGSAEAARREAWRRKFAMDDLYRGRAPEPRASGARGAGGARQDAGRHHAEHRRASSGIRRPGGARHRAARQRHLCEPAFRAAQRHELDWIRVAVRDDRRAADLRRVRRAS